MFGAVHLQQITPPLAFLQNNSVSFTSGNLWDCYTCRGGIYLHKYCLHFFFRHEINFCQNKPFASIISMISCSKGKCSWQERVFVTTAPLTGSWRSKTIFKSVTIFGWNLCQQITNYKLQITIYETKGRQVKDLPAAHDLQPAEKLLSSLFVREFHDHVPTRATLNQRDEFYTLCMHKMNKFLDKA